MKSSYELEIDSLALGLTKPATKCGVPLIAFYISILSCLMGWMLFQAFSGNASVVSLFAFVVIWLVFYATMLLMTMHDAFGLSIAWLNFTSFRTHATNSFWGNTDSYTP